MADETMPATEAQDEGGEIATYECAFHILPTVADEEVPATFTALKERIERAGGTVKDEEEPQRFDLAYEVGKRVDGQMRRFNASYFGWVRFDAEPAVAASVNDEFGRSAEVLRHIVVRLTREEIAHPFSVFAARAAEAAEASDEEGAESAESEEEKDATA